MDRNGASRSPILQSEFVFSEFWVLTLNSLFSTVQGSNSESLPLSQRQIWPAFCTREPVLDSHAFSPLTLLTSVSSNNQTYIKGTTRLRAKMASPSLLSQISCRGASDPISKPPLWESFAPVTKRARQTRTPNRSRSRFAFHYRTER
jgi:hypothetical protein